MISLRQKLAFGAVAVLVCAYLGFVVYRAGGPLAYLSSLQNRMPVAPSISISPASIPIPTQSPVPFTSTPAIAPTRLVSPTPVIAPSPILTAMNVRRAAVGMSALVTNSTLQRIAQSHASDMASRGFFSHTDPDGVTFQQRITAGGYTGTAEAENLGVTTLTSVSVIDAWMGSEGHRINMLNGAYHAVGIGVATGTWQGMAATYVVAVFGNLQ